MSHTTRTPLDRESGSAVLKCLQDDATTADGTQTLEHQAAGMVDWVVSAVFGGTYQREGLSLRDRRLINLGALTALGGVDPQLAGHVHTSMRVGMSEQEVIEALVHLPSYVGLPKALAALRVAEQALHPVDGENVDRAAAR